MRGTGKSKGTAMALAILLSQWTWLYTYKQDATKFWIGTILNLLFFWTFIVPIGVWVWAMIDATNTVNKTEYYWE